MPIDTTVHAMTKADLSKTYDCTGRARSGCRLSAKVLVDGLPFCARCGRRESATIATINAEREGLSAQLAAISGRKTLDWLKGRTLRV